MKQNMCVCLYVCVYITVLLCCKAEINTVNQLHFNKFLKKWHQKIDIYLNIKSSRSYVKFIDMFSNFKLLREKIIENISLQGVIYALKCWYF